MAAHPLRGEHLPRSSRPCFCATPNTPAALLPEPVALGKISASAGLWGRERSRFSPRGGGAGRAQGSCCPARGRGAGAAFPGGPHPLWPCGAEPSLGGGRRKCGSLEHVASHAAASGAQAARTGGFAVALAVCGAPVHDKSFNDLRCVDDSYRR